MNRSGGSRLPASWLLAMALALAAVGAWWASVPPVPAGAGAPLAGFSADRAMADVRAIGHSAHPVGSAEHSRVRDRLDARMAALGLVPRIVPGRAVKVKPGSRGLEVSGADTLNLIGVLPGMRRGAPAVLLMAHYDSVASSPGAADDGAGVAAALEIVRALAAGGPRRRDVMIVFTDAEEHGLLGARAFFASDAAKHVGFVVNMDMRGGAGRAIMHETGHLSGGAIDLYRRNAIHPTTDSVAAYVERLIRNSSDFRIAVDHGLGGLNYAILDREFDYHAASSTPAALDVGSLQHLGEQVLAVARAAAMAADLPARSADPAYASVLGWFVLAYPPWVGWLIIAAAAGLAAIAWRRAPAPGTEMLRATGAALHLLLTLALLLALVRLATGVPFGFTVGRPLLARWEIYEAALALCCVGGALAWWALALAGARWTAAAAPPIIAVLAMAAGGSGWILPALGAVAALLAVPSFRGSLAPRAIGLGLFGVVMLLAVALQIAAPVANVIPTWSLLGGGVILLGAAIGRRAGWLVAMLAIALLLAQQAATAHLLLLAVGETIAGVAAPFALCAALVLAPLLAGLLTARSAGWGGAAFGAGAIMLVLAIRFGDPASAKRPAISQIVHVTDLAGGRFYRATSLAFPDAWTTSVLGPHPASTPLPLYDHALVARGEAIAVARPRISSVRQPDGTVLLRIAGPPGTRELRVALTASVAIRRATVNGIAVPMLAAPGRIDRLEWVGRDPVITLRIVPQGQGPGRLVARLSTLRDGWPADAQPLAPRPATTMPWYDSDAAVTLSTIAVAL